MGEPTPPSWWARLKVWRSAPPVPSHEWVRQPTRSFYLIDDYCVALEVTMDVDSFPGYRWRIAPNGVHGVEPTQEDAERAAIQAARDLGMSWEGWDG